MDKEELRHLGKELRYNKKFPKGANVNFYEITGRDTLTELTYERGVEDFTMACGTGTGSVAAVLTEKNLVSGNDVHVSVPGGELFITDSSDPQEIKDMLGISKSAFKRAVGNLLKKKLIDLGEKSIRLVK